MAHLLFERTRIPAVTKGNEAMKKLLQTGVLVLTGLLGAEAQAQENASNPLAAVNNTDIRYQSFDLDGSSRQDAYIDGAYMLTPNLKLKYELHYNWTDVTGDQESGVEKASLKLISFPSQRMLNETWGVKTAVGLEWIIDAGNADKGIGTGSDQLAPLVGLAFANTNTGLSLIPLVQHYASYNGDADISQTAMRLIALQPFADDYWAKLDLKVPYDWTNDAWPATAEIQLGYNVNSRLALYADLMAGLGDDRPYERGAGLGMRFLY